jgi:hypothetical protein
VGLQSTSVGYFIDGEEHIGSDDWLACVNGIPRGLR